MRRVDKTDRQQKAASAVYSKKAVHGRRALLLQLHYFLDQSGYVDECAPRIYVHILCDVLRNSPILIPGLVGERNIRHVHVHAKCI